MHFFGVEKSPFFCIYYCIAMPLTQQVVQATCVALCHYIAATQNDEPVGTDSSEIDEVIVNPALGRSIIHIHGPAESSAFINQLLEGSPRRFQELFRLTQDEFTKLHDWLTDYDYLRGSRYQNTRQKLVIFLYIMATGASQRQTAFFLLCAQSAVHRAFHHVLTGMQQYHAVMVRMPPSNWLDPDIELDPSLNALNGAIGAIDGTHISAWIRSGSAAAKGWYDRKGNITQNVLAVVRSDLSFMWVLPGAEGSMNDASLLGKAFSFGLSIPKGRYLLADAGFGSTTGIIVPFPNVRYHLQDWREADKPIRTIKELYNLRHARARVVVEQAFGLLKRTWKIIRNSAPEYAFIHQKAIIYAATALQNLQRDSRVKPPSLSAEDRDTLRQARMRAERLLVPRSPQKVRWLAAHCMAVQYRKYTGVNVGEMPDRRGNEYAGESGPETSQFEGENSGEDEGDIEGDSNVIEIDGGGRSNFGILPGF